MNKAKELIRSVENKPIEEALMLATATKLADIRVSNEGQAYLQAFFDRVK